MILKKKMSVDRHIRLGGQIFCGLHIEPAARERVIMVPAPC
jgi:hypothetical protein